MLGYFKRMADRVEIKQRLKDFLKGLWYSYAMFFLFEISMLLLMYIELWVGLLKGGNDRTLMIGISHSWPYYIALEIGLCIFLFTLTFYTLKLFLPIKKWIIALIVQGILMLAVWLYIVYEQDWNFKIVTIDSYMIDGWAASLVCLPLYFIMKLLHHYPKIFKWSKILFNGIIILAHVGILLLALISLC